MSLLKSLLKRLKKKVIKFLKKSPRYDDWRNKRDIKTISRYFKKEKYKVGLISINIHTLVLNFASPIHTWAFQKFLEKHNLDAEIIDYKPCYYANDADPRHPYDRLLKRKSEGKSVDEKELERWKALYNEREKRFDRFEEFIQKYYRKTKECYNQEILDTVDLGYDAYMCVTDVIWKYNKNTGFDRGFFLNCKTMEGKKRIAYAASIGAGKEYSGSQSKEFEKLIEPLDYISVREKRLYTHINDKTKKRASLVLDPVFFHEKKFYKDLMIRPKRKRGYVLIYVVMGTNENIVETAIEFAKKHDLDVIELSEFTEHQGICGVNHEFVYDIGIEEWLGYMYDAEYIFTNSFHCCVFSIILQKQFFAGKRGGDKLPWLLETFNLEDRQVYSVDECEIPQIDFKPVEKLRKKYVLQSKAFVMRSLYNVKRNKKGKVEGIEKFMDLEQEGGCY